MTTQDFPGRRGWIGGKKEPSFCGCLKELGRYLRHADLNSGLQAEFRDGRNQGFQLGIHTRQNNQSFGAGIGLYCGPGNKMTAIVIFASCPHSDHSIDAKIPGRSGTRAYLGLMSWTIGWQMTAW